MYWLHLKNLTTLCICLITTYLIVNWRVHIKRLRCQSLNQGTWVDHVRAPQSFWINRKRAPISLYPSQHAWSGRPGLSDTLLLDMSVTSPDEYIIIIARYTYRYQITNVHNTRRCLILIMLIINISKRLACDQVFENFSKRLAKSPLNRIKDSWQSTSFNGCA